MASESKRRESNAVELAQINETCQNDDEAALSLRHINSAPLVEEHTAEEIQEITEVHHSKKERNTKFFILSNFNSV
jgi:hypothetical protein